MLANKHQHCPWAEFAISGGFRSALNKRNHHAMDRAGRLAKGGEREGLLSGGDDVARMDGG